jgi:hypothetical protein
MYESKLFLLLHFIIVNKIKQLNYAVQSIYAYFPLILH